MDKPPTDHELNDHDFSGMDSTETITRGPLITNADQQCERCGDSFDVGVRSYLIGRVGPDDQCCKYCAVADGADDAFLSGQTDSPR